jgi:hypothetical protein
MGGLERKPGGSSLVHDEFAPSSAQLGPVKRTLTDQLTGTSR